MEISLGLVDARNLVHLLEKGYMAAMDNIYLKYK
jgi:hypothetical protein